LHAVLASHDLGSYYRAQRRLLRVERRLEIQAAAQRDCQTPNQVDPFDARPVCGVPQPKAAKHATITLKIRSLPSWGTAEIEGFGSCDTPCSLHLPPGTYMVRVRNPELHLRGKMRVELTEDESVKTVEVALMEE